MKGLGITDIVTYRFSKHDPKDKKKYYPDPELWAKSESLMKEALDELKINYYEAEGEAAFYGPKIDFMATDAIGREHQLATAQLDFVQPARFGLTYADSDGAEKTPVMTHLAIAGSLERFLSVYIEHTAGAFPLWVAPVQIKILPVSEKHSEHGLKIQKKLQEAGIRAVLDTSNETLGKKVRGTKLEKVPAWLVIGDKEIEAGTLTLERRDSDTKENHTLSSLISSLTKEISERR